PVCDAGAGDRVQRSEHDARLHAAKPVPAHAEGRWPFVCRYHRPGDRSGGGGMTVITITSADAARGSLILINPDHPVRHEPAREELQPVGPGVLLEQQAAAMLNEVFARLGVTDEIVPVSGYRPLAEQQRLYDEA